MDNKIDQLEYTVMELGTEIFRLKSQISEMNSVQEGMTRTLKNLKDVLEEKGLISEEDFDSASLKLDVLEADSEEFSGENFLDQISPKPDFH